MDATREHLAPLAYSLEVWIRIPSIVTSIRPNTALDRDSSSRNCQSPPPTSPQECRKMLSSLSDRELRKRIRRRRRSWLDRRDRNAHHRVCLLRSPSKKAKQRAMYKCKRCQWWKRWSWSHPTFVNKSSCVPDRPSSTTGLPVTTATATNAKFTCLQMLVD